MFRWMVFFFLILGAILAFVAFVLGMPIPGLTQSGYQPNGPFNP